MMVNREFIHPDEFKSRLSVVTASMDGLHRSVIESGDVPYEIITNPDLYLNADNAKLSMQGALDRLQTKLLGIDPDMQAAEAQLYDPIWVQIGLNKLAGRIATENFVDHDQSFDPFLTSIFVSAGIIGSNFANSGKAIEVAHNSGEIFTSTQNTAINERVHVKSVSTISHDDTKGMYVHHVKATQLFSSGFSIDDWATRREQIDYELTLPQETLLPHDLLRAIETATQELRSVRADKLRSAVAEELAN